MFFYIIEMANEFFVWLLFTTTLFQVNANILMVDWSRGSYNTIYVDSARATQVATNKIFKYDFFFPLVVFFE